MGEATHASGAQEPDTNTRAGRNSHTTQNAPHAHSHTRTLTRTHAHTHTHRHTPRTGEIAGSTTVTRPEILQRPEPTHTCILWYVHRQRVGVYPLFAYETATDSNPHTRAHTHALARRNTQPGREVPTHTWNSQGLFGRPVLAAPLLGVLFYFLCTHLRRGP